MKIHHLGTSCFAVLLMLCISSATYAQVLLTLTDDGTDLTFHYKGKMELAAGHDFVGTTDRDRPGRIGEEFYSFSGDYFRGSGFGSGDNTGASTTVTGLAGTGDNVPSNGVGLGFGIRSGELWWDKAYGDLGGTIDIDRKWTLAGFTVDSYLNNATILDAGPAVIWTHNKTGSTVTMVNGNELNDKQRSYLKFAETGKFMSFKNSDRDANKSNKKLGTHDVFLAPGDDKDYTKMEVTAVKHDKYFGLRVGSFLPRDGYQRWLEVGDDHKLIVGYRKQGDEPGRGQFLSGTTPFGLYLEAMWVNKAGGSKAVIAHPDHNFYLTGSGSGVISKDFMVDPPKDKSAGWKLVPIN